jgi:uridine kinase
MSRAKIWERRGIKEIDGGGELDYGIFKNFVNVTMYPQYNNNIFVIKKIHDLQIFSLPQNKMK